MTVPKNADLVAAQSHEILRAEKVGDTLVVVPRGEPMEFSNLTFEHELGILRRLASDETVRNIVCDFSQKDYFSSELVVPVLGLRDHVRTRGRFVTAGMSDQMSKMFEHSESGTHILQFPDRSSAIRQVADVSFTESVSARIRKNRGILRCTLAVLAVAAAIALWILAIDPYFNGSPARKLYTQIATVWADADRVTHANPTKANWKGLGNRMREQLFDPVMVVREKPEKTEAEMAVLTAANRLQGFSASPRQSLEFSQKSFLELAEKARIAIEAEDGVRLRALKPITIPQPVIPVGN